MSTTNGKEQEVEKELVDKFYQQLITATPTLNRPKYQAKQCALIAVEYAAQSHPTTTVLVSEPYNKKYIDGLTKSYGVGGPDQYQYTGPKCIKGSCQNFPNYETKHHKDCPFYPNSLSEKYDRLESAQPSTVLGWVDVKDKSVKMPIDEDFLVCFDNGEIRRNMEDLPFAVATHWMRIIPPNTINKESKLIERKEGSCYVYYNASKEMPPNV